MANSPPELYFPVPFRSYEQQVRKAKVQNSAPLVWNDEARESFKKTKEMVAKAIALSVPDWQGASDGSLSLIHI